MKLRTAILLAGCADLLCAQAPERTYQARLHTVLASHSPSGTPIEARLAGPVDSDGAPALPRGVLVSGQVKRSKRVGLGFVRERASLEVEFTRCAMPDGSDIPCKADLISLDNARERLVRPNHIQGILAASHPHSWLGGVWYRPAPLLFKKAPAGLTGAAGMVHSRMAPNPLSAAAIVGSRLALYRLPDPEIELLPGSVIFLRVASDPPARNEEILSSGPQHLDESFLESLRSQPASVNASNGAPVADITNFGFIGSRDDVIKSFQAAGWTTAEPLSAKTFARTYAAFASMKAYPNAPVSALYYQGRLPDLVFQKSLNSIAQRHHIRIWRVELSGKELWLGAATQDVAISFDLARLVFTHRIDPNIDRERSILLNDLIDAGCVAWQQTVSRPKLNDAERRQPITTDGAIFLVGLQACLQADTLISKHSRPRHRFLFHVSRRIILESRQYFSRSNAYYWAYRAARWSGRLMRIGRGNNAIAPHPDFDSTCRRVGSARKPSSESTLHYRRDPCPI